MQQIKGKRVITFDIEATGLSAIDNDFFLAQTYDGEKIITINSLKDMIRFEDYFNWDKHIIITFNGQNYRGGYDIPFLRTQLARKGIRWSLQDYWHLDLLPLVRKYFNTSINEYKIDSVGKLYKVDLIKICEANNVEYQSSKQATYNMLQEMDTDWLDYKKENTNEYNDMQSVYQYFFDTECKEEYIDGAEIPGLIEEGEYDVVADHCERDVKRLWKLADLLMDYLAGEYIHKHLERL